ncbi:MAG: hypothetical protein KC431_24065, partial [Myxococcales bacterium]|nr:hypothetical protein [Myxococcales bacterium]
ELVVGELVAAAVLSLGMTVGVVGIALAPAHAYEIMGGCMALFNLRLAYDLRPVLLGGEPKRAA